MLFGGVHIHGACSDVMVRIFDLYAYACGFESGLGHCAYGPLANLLTLSFSPLAYKCLKMRVLNVDVET